MEGPKSRQGETCIRSGGSNCFPFDGRVNNNKKKKNGCGVYIYLSIYLPIYLPVSCFRGEPPREQAVIRTMCALGAPVGRRVVEEKPTDTPMRGWVMSNLYPSRERGMIPCEPSASSAPRFMSSGKEQ